MLSFFGPGASPCLALLGALLGLAAWQSLPGLGRGAAQKDQVALPPKPESLVCSAGASCPPWSRFELISRRLHGGVGPPAEVLKRALSARFDQRVANGKAPVLLYVGPASTATELLIGRDFYQRYPTFVVLVEPNPSCLPGLTALVKRIGFNSSRVSIQNAALCAEDADAAPLFAFSNDLGKAFPDAGPDFGSESFSLSREVLVTSHTRDYKLKGAKQFSQEEWTAMLDFVKPIQVRCVAPASLLRELGLEAADVDVLIMDAEGLDLRLLTFFLGMPGFSPAKIQWEWNIWPNFLDANGRDISEQYVASLALTLWQLAGRGYDVYQFGKDLMAVTTHLA